MPMGETQILSLVAETMRAVLDEHRQSDISILNSVREDQKEMHKENLARFDELKAGQCRLDRILTGKDDPEKGIVIKVDRHGTAIREIIKRQDAMSSRSWTAVIGSFVAIIGLAGKLLVDRLSKGHTP